MTSHLASLSSLVSADGSSTLMQTLITLVTDMSVVVVVAYIITRTQACISEVLDGRTSRHSQALLIVVFGAFSIYGTVSGIRIDQSVANIRDLGPAVAGLIGGPWIGLGAGLIGGAHRMVYGADLTRVACSIATVCIGLAAGLIQRRRGGFIGLPGAVLFSVVAELFHVALVFAISRPLDEVAHAMREVTPPMIVANAAGMAVFALLIQHVVREDQDRKERDHLLRESERIDSELRVARDIQLSMVPKVFVPDPPRAEFRLHARLLPAKEVGGDLYDFFLLDQHRLFFVVGDVSGKGVPAALFMAVIRTFMRGLAREYESPAALLERVNAEMVRDNAELYFVTVFCGILDLRTGEVVYTNAGHNPPYVVAPEAEAGAERLHLPKGMVLAVMPGVVYRTETITLTPGSVLVAYTDGVTEAMSPSHEQFGEGRLKEVLDASAGCPVDEITSAVFDAVHAHAAEEPQSDDITVLTLCFVQPEA